MIIFEGLILMLVGVLIALVSRRMQAVAMENTAKMHGVPGIKHLQRYVQSRVYIYLDLLISLTAFGLGIAII